MNIKLKNMEQTKNDNLSKIRVLLMSGAKLTSITVLRLIGTTEIRHYLSKLRREGLAIKDQWLERDGKRFKTWWIE